MLDDAPLAQYLDRLGWERVPHGAGTLRAVRDTEQGDVAVYVRLSQNWLIASVVPFLVTGGDNPHDLARLSGGSSGGSAAASSRPTASRT